MAAARAFDPVAGRRRNIVERCFAQLKQYRVIATRHDKTALSYQARIDLATSNSGFEDTP
jgi:transposase